MNTFGKKIRTLNLFITFLFTCIVFMTLPQCAFSNENGLKNSEQVQEILIKKIGDFIISRLLPIAKSNDRIKEVDIGALEQDIHELGEFIKDKNINELKELPKEEMFCSYFIVSVNLLGIENTLKQLRLCPKNNCDVENIKFQQDLLINKILYLNSLIIDCKKPK